MVAIQTVKTEDKKRIEYIDVAKFIGISLMIFAHLRGQERETAWIDAFHRPLFFFLSGRTVKIRKEEGFYGFLKRKIHSYVIPYFVLCLVSLFVTRITFCIQGNNQAISWPWVVNQRIQCLEERRYTSIWFVGALFTSELFFYGIVSLGKGKLWLSSIYAGIFLALAIVYNYFTPGFLIWSMDSAFFGTLFVFLGYVFSSKELEKIHDALLWKRIPSFFIGSVGLAIVIFVQQLLLKHYNNAHLSRWGCNFSPYYIVFPLALLGCLSIVRISYGISNKIMGKIGQRTLIILNFQQSIGIPVYRLMAKGWAANIGPNQRWNFNWIRYTFVGTLFILALSIPIYYIFRFTPLCIVVLNKKLPYSIQWKKKQTENPA